MATYRKQDAYVLVCVCVCGRVCERYYMIYDVCGPVSVLTVSGIEQGAYLELKLVQQHTHC